MYGGRGGGTNLRSCGFLRFLIKAEVLQVMRSLVAGVRDLKKEGQSVKLKSWRKEGVSEELC